MAQFMEKFTSAQQQMMVTI